MNTDKIQYDVAINATLDDKTINVSMSFCTTTVPPSQATSVSQVFENALWSIVNDAEKPISDFDLLSDRDRHQILKWNVAHPVTADRVVHELFMEQAIRHPSKVAITSWDGDLTYKELDDYSSHLAQHLILDLALESQAVVALCFDKSAWTIVALMAILKAGGTCVPLNPEHPIQRLQYLVGETKAAVVLVSPKYAHFFDERKVVRIAQVDWHFMDQLSSKRQTLVKHPGLESCTSFYQNFTSKVTPDQAAVIVFTSGSTGKPKGIVLEHRALCSSIHAHGSIMCFGTSSRVLQFAAYTFDASLTEIFTTLLYGGCVCVPDHRERMNDISGAVNRMGVNLALLTPTIVSLLSPESLPTLQTLVLIGEQVPQQLVVTWARHVFLINGYGPSECTIFSTAYPGMGPSSKATTIGKAVGTVLWIADSTNHKRLAPIGGVGELLIQGPVLARGYLNDLEKTNAAFIQSQPWLLDTRLYKTGDLVRYNPDGLIDFIGRKDTQIKLHGQRIELAEIEHHLSLENRVRQSAIIMGTAGPCEKQLVAVVVLEGCSDQTTEDLSGNSLELVDEETKKIVPGQQVISQQVHEIKESLSNRLPAYYIPTVWAIVKTLPITISGKLDRMRIREWVETMDEAIHQKILGIAAAPVSERIATVMEEQIRLVWGRVLGIPPSQIGLDRSFTSLGGDSITAMQIRAQCRSTLDITITVEETLRCKSISQLAACAKPANQYQWSTEEELTDIPFQLSPIQQLYFSQVATESHEFYQSLLVGFTERVSAESVAHAVKYVVSRHPMLRARFTQHSGKWTQRVVEEVAGSYGYETLTLDTAKHISNMASDCQTTLNITDGPVFAANLYNIRDEDMQDCSQSLFLVAHHLVVDLVSWRIILADLEEYIRAGHLALKTPLPFSVWSQSVENYCNQYCNGDAPRLENQPDNFQYWGIQDKDSNLFGDIVVEECILDARATSMLFGAANDSLRTEPVDIILATLITSFSEVFERTPTIFCEGHGRESWDSDIDLSETVGWFTTLSAVFLQQPGTDVIEAVRLVKDLRRRFPRNSWQYFVSRFTTTAATEPKEFLFNYFGRAQQFEGDNALFYLQSGVPPTTGTTVRRLALFDIGLVLEGDKVNGDLARISFTFNRHMRHQDRIRDWIRLFGVKLENVINTLVRKAAEYTLGDFPLLPLTYRGLENLTKELPVSSLDEVENIYSCTPMQQGILISQIKAPETYRVVQVCEVLSEDPRNTLVEVEKLVQAWQTVVNHHPVLRTIFLEVDSRSRKAMFGQIVLKRHATSTTVLQYDSDDDKAAINYLSEHPGLDYVARAPLHQFTVCETPSRVFARIEISHALTDGTSMAILIRDLNLAYRGRLNVQAPLYADYIEYLQRQDRSRALEYWKTYLADISPCQLPLLSSASQVKHSEHHSLPVRLGDISSLRRFCADRSITLANLFQVAWGLVLKSYTSSNDICFGYLTSGRDVPIAGIYDIVGPFINMLVCRLNFSGATTASQLLDEVQKETLRGLDHQHTPLIDVQHTLGIERGGLFNTGMSLQRHIAGPINETAQDGGIKIVPVASQDPTEVSSIGSRPIIIIAS